MKIGSGLLYRGDCLDVMKNIRDGTVDMILADLPYGTTQNKWDSCIDLEKLWPEYWRVCKPNAAIVMTAQCPFDKMLGASQIRHLKYEWIWEKTEATGHLNAKKQPMKAHENILVFYKEQCTYNPQMGEGVPYDVNHEGISTTPNYGKQVPYRSKSDGSRYPRSVVKFAKDFKNKKIHPTQKPVSLFEYLIRTYTNESETVLDNVSGSGTAAIAAINANRRWICIEMDQEYHDKSADRIRDHLLGITA